MAEKWIIDKAKELLASAADINDADAKKVILNTAADLMGRYYGFAEDNRADAYDDE